MTNNNSANTTLAPLVGYRGLSKNLDNTIHSSLIFKDNVVPVSLKSIEMYSNFILNEKGNKSLNNLLLDPKSLPNNKEVLNTNKPLRYVPIGDMHMSLNILKNHFNSIVKTLPKFKEVSGNNITYRIRHYLNMLTRFSFKLSNSSYNFYLFNNTNNLLFKMEKAAQMLRIAFLTKGCLISKPRFEILNSHETISNEFDIKSNNKIKTKIIIHLFYLVKATTLDAQSNTLNGQGKAKLITDVYNNKFLYLNDYLTKLFKTEVELDLVRLYQPYQDSEVLVNFLNNKSYNNKFIRLTSRVFKSMNIYKTNKAKIASLLGNTDTKIIGTLTSSYPSGVSGLNIKLAGRPINEKIIPRLTVKRAQRGNFNRLNTKVNQISTFTDKSRKGAFNFTVRLSHIFR
uniref:Small ribosomal subunit protein uS3m n=1 Tax=Pyrrhoderma lamaoense TaxID=2282106 RepID=A0A5B9RD95_9AGAM|nr:ribosomal protein S3 [Phellinus lamaoensis]YP_010697843.1 ribosomal protein S3 [Phellinidium ferrugineofuscum]YP_010697879.1 ribosomal protein S3 [Fuscoporia viticola]QEG57130.1 ribosomal protein S3 [Phellinus lamaoensis]WCF76804.1 ribosomal protein S3 [Phellinidium ferrugineofuscum]WCF76840.1 ribosomal protein S3 [Fuscoporia viticola]